VYVFDRTTRKVGRANVEAHACVYVRVCVCVCVTEQLRALKGRLLM